MREDELISSLPAPKPLSAIPQGAECYIREVWSWHCKRRQSDFPQASSAEFSLALGWFHDGVPLAIVLRAMKDTTKAGSSLFYYRAQVEAAYVMWRKALGPYAMAEYEAQRGRA